MKQINKYSVFFIILLGLVLRIININQSLWLDEAISALAAKNFSFYGIVFEFLKGDNHPPLYYLILRLWGLFFGFSDVVLRLLSVMAGTFTVLITYLFLKKLINRKVALIGSFLLATSPLHIYYSQEIRMYPLLGLWAIGLMYILTFIKDNDSNFWLWLLFSVGLIGLVAIDYTGIFLLPVFLIVAWKEKISFKKIILGFVPLGIALIGWAPILIQQKTTALVQLSSLPGWRQLAGGTPKEVIVLWMKFVLGRISFYPKLGYYIMTGIFSIPIIWSFYKSNQKNSFWLWSFLVIPLTVSFISSVIVPSFNYFRFIYVLPAFYGLIAAGILKLSKRIQIAVTLTVLIGNVLGISLYYVDTGNQREQWKQAVSYIESSGSQLVFFEFPEPFAPYLWYSNKTIKAVGGLTQLSSERQKTFNKMNTELTPITKKVMYVSYIRDLTDSDYHVQKTLEEHGFKPSESKSFVGVGEIIQYER